MIEVRLARAGEAEGIAQLHVASRRAAYAGIFRESATPAAIFEQRRRLWTRGIAARNVWVALRGDALLGVAQAGTTRDADSAAGTAELYVLYVALGVWRSGVGTALLAHLAPSFAARGDRWLTVWVLAENRIGRAFYDRRGFVADGAARDVDGRGLMEVRLVKPLAA